MIAILIILLVLLLFGIILLFKFNVTGTEEQDDEYNIDGYHIYYDRKILRIMEQENNQPTKVIVK